MDCTGPETQWYTAYGGGTGEGDVDGRFAASELLFFFFLGLGGEYAGLTGFGQTFRNFKAFTSSIEAIYLVEASATLREIQKKLLCGDAAAMRETEIGHESTSKYFDVPVVWVEDIRLLPHGKLSRLGLCS